MVSILKHTRLIVRNINKPTRAKIPQEILIVGNNKDSPWGLLIPIVVLLTVMFGIGEPWLMIPIIILGIILISGVAQGSRIQTRQREYDHWKAPEPGSMTSGYTPEPSKPIYDQKKQKDQGITCGTFIPIIIVGWLFLETLSWIFLIPLVFLFVALIETASKHICHPIPAAP